VHLKGANSTTVSGSSLETTCLALGGPFLFCFFGVNGIRNKQFTLTCRASISSVQGLFFSYGRFAFLERLKNRCLLIGGCGQTHISIKDGCSYL